MADSVEKQGAMRKSPFLELCDDERLKFISGFGVEESYSLMWPKGGEVVRVNWRKNSLLVPPEGWYHHHFTTSAEPARHLELRRGLRGVGPIWLATVSEHEGGHLLQHEDEPEEIRAMYEADLKKEGVPFRMAPIKWNN